MTKRTRSSTRLTKKGDRMAGNDMMKQTMKSLSAEDVQRRSTYVMSVRERQPAAHLAEYLHMAHNVKRLRVMILPLAMHRPCWWHQHRFHLAPLPLRSLEELHAPCTLHARHFSEGRKLLH
eukprot:4463150-Pleurochrysis_carterae.AAC.2